MTAGSEAGESASAKLSVMSLLKRSNTFSTTPGSIGMVISSAFSNVSGLVRASGRNNPAFPLCRLDDYDGRI